MESGEGQQELEKICIQCFLADQARDSHMRAWAEQCWRCIFFRVAAPQRLPRGPMSLRLFRYLMLALVVVFFLLFVCSFPWPVLSQVRLLHWRLD